MKDIWCPLEEYSWDKVNGEVGEPLIRKQLDYVFANSPFYKKKIGKDAVGSSFTLDDLRSFPFTAKQELLDDELRYSPFGSYLIGGKTKIMRVHRTSGTNARPLLLALSKADIENSIECGARCFWAADLRPEDVVVHCLNYCMWSGGVTDHQSLERTGAAVIPYGVGDSSNLIRTILMIRPSAIHCTPSYLSKLEVIVSQEFNSAPSKLGLRLGLFGGEGGVQDKAFRRRIEDVWGFRAMDANYGMSDVLSMFGAECRVRDGLHFMGQGVIHPELKKLNDDTTLSWEPGARGELVLTHLCKECQPLVRYRTHDIIEIVSMERCECGRRSPRFRVIGRIEDMIIVRGVNVFMSSIAAVINEHLDMLTGEFRVAVDKADPIERCIVKVEVKKGKARAGLDVYLRDLFKSALYIRPSVEILPEASLMRTAGKTQYLERIL